MQHLQSTFQEGMNWNNYGKWEIDHIIPCSAFDLTIEENQRKCFHYSNLQALWERDNIVKGGINRKLPEFSLACPSKETDQSDQTL